MSKHQKKNLKRIISLVCIVLLVGFLAAMPLLAQEDENTDGPQASILSGTVGRGSVNNKVIGGGTLAEQEALTVTVPASVKLRDYLVSNGETVKAGQPIASIDRVTVMTAISEVQETLNELAEKIEAESETDTDGEVSALAGGTIKKLYAEEGASVQEIMLEYGSLAVLSLDGRMAVDLTSSSSLGAGEAVALTLEDGTTVTGRVESNLSGKMTVTTEDDGYAAGQTVQISTTDGALLGSGELYIFSPWNATAYAGRIESVHVSEGDTVSAGKSLMSLTGTGYTAAYRRLLSQRQAYEELMLELFSMYQTEQLTAPCDGVVSGIDGNSVQLLAAQKQRFTVSLLSNAPHGDGEALYTNIIGQVTSISGGVWAVNTNPTGLAVTDYKDLSGLPTDPADMTEPRSFNPTPSEGAAIPVYELGQDGAWTQLEHSAVIAGDILLFAGDADGNFVWVVRVGHTSVPTEPDEPEEDPSDEPSDEPEEDPSDEPSDEPEDEPEEQEENKGGSGASSEMSYGSMSGFSGMQNNMMMQMQMAEQEDPLYDLDTADVASVTPQDTMTVTITVSELDVSSLAIGMGAEVILDALGGARFIAVISDISNTGTNDGGYSYFTVTLSMGRSEDMLIGMNATATVVTAVAEDVLTVPAEALVEQGAKTLVYTGYDEENGVLTDPVEVTVGASDGKNVELIAGLGEGETVFYAYYDTPELSFTPEFSARRGSGFNLFSLAR